MDNKNIYNPSEFEAQMRELWEKEKTYSTAKSLKLEAKSQKAFCLSMFPYPSGTGLHVGHVRIYTGTDVLARYFRMQGKAVLHPMGWDAFGLPAENAAIKAKKNPMDMVPSNITNFKRQMQMLGLSYDWDKELSTTDPAYYKWTQWLFIQFFKMGLLYKKNTPIHFCPKCKTGLAEEEVLANGTHERCGSVITKKDLPQWIFRITAYAEQLLADLKLLDWPKGILEMQKNWIGKKEGINIEYRIKNSEERIVCFTTAPVNFGMTFIVVAPEHSLVKKIMNGEIEVENSIKSAVSEYCKKSITKSDIDRQTEGKEKTGVFAGLYATNQVAGSDVPVWVSDFVIGHVGTGAVQGCPGHDYKDFEFAKKFNIPIIRVVVGPDGDLSPITKSSQVIVKGMKGKMVNSEFLNGLEFHEGLEKTMDYIEKKGWGKRVVSYHLRDWIFSRQRYWGEPIPMIFCQKCAEKGLGGLRHPERSEGSSDQRERKNASLDSSPHLQRDQNDNMMKGWFSIPEDQLPLELPYTKSYEPTDTGESPLSTIEGFSDTVCPHCGGKAVRETDTMPNWAGSCWYFIRFAMENEQSVIPVKAGIQPINFNSKKDNYPLDSRVRGNDKRTMKEEWMETMADSPWSPVDWYLGGAEHAVLHLLYARFWVKALRDLGLLNYPEPFLRLRNVGMVLAEDHRKMSKSLGNTLNPDDVVAQYGADTLRMYEMFMAPFNMEISWSPAALQGAHRFLKRVWSLYSRQSTVNSRQSNMELVDKLNKTIQKVGDDIAQTKYNTAIAALMEFLNAWETNPELSLDEAKKFIQILAPFAPFITEKIWRDIFHEKTSIHLSSWPTQTKVSIINAVVKLPIQTQGKFRGVIEISPELLNEKNIENMVLNEPKLAKYLTDKKYKLIYVKGRICNFVLR